MGSELTSQALKRGHRVRLLTHRHSPPLSHQNLETVSGSISDPKVLRKGCEGVGAVIHLVGIIQEVRPEVTFRVLHVEATRNILEAAKSIRVSRFLHMSALGTRENAVTMYHKTKWEGEKLVRSSGLAWTIFRPSLIWGDGGFRKELEKLAAIPLLYPLLGKGAFLLQPIAVEDVARCFLDALEMEETIGKTYELGGDRVFTYRELVDLVLRRLGRRRWKIPIPLSLIKMQVWMMERVLQKSPLTLDQLTMLEEGNVLRDPSLRKTFLFPLQKIA